ncbi:MAG: hypothetical protein LBS31_12870, partial [Candidatus Adiutrix sp.]|nr:hypothetical protein [Candidatus Adiutrix sp.]
MRDAPIMRQRLKTSAGSRALSGRALPVFLTLSIALIIGWLLVALKFIFLPMLLALFATFLLS